MRSQSSRRPRSSSRSSRWHGISFFNQDLEAAPPADWLAFREKLQKSDGVIFVTPEYNRAIPGVLKNAIDVASRPYGKSSFIGKPVGIISQFAGPARRRQRRQDAAEHPAGHCRPDPAAAGNLSERRWAMPSTTKGKLTKESLQNVLQQYIDAFAAFVEKQNTVTG